jgi:hypothetical protein
LDVGDPVRCLEVASMALAASLGGDHWGSCGSGCGETSSYSAPRVSSSSTSSAQERQEAGLKSSRGGGRMVGDVTGVVIGAGPGEGAGARVQTGAVVAAGRRSLALILLFLPTISPWTRPCAFDLFSHVLLLRLFSLCFCNSF